MAFAQMLYGVSYWGTASCVLFLLASMFSDLILIKASLMTAYLCLITDLMSGWPPMAAWWDPATILPVGLLGWCLVSVAFQAVGLAHLLWDERRIDLQGNEEQLWKLFYRRSGMTRLEFKELLKRGTWNRYKAGDIIYVKGYSPLCLHVIVEGVVSVCLDDNQNHWWNLYSGEVFDYRLCNLFGVYIGFDKVGSAIAEVKAETDCLFFTWHASQLSEMAFAVSPSVSGFWRNFILYTVGKDFTWRATKDATKIPATDSKGVEESPGWYQGERTRDLTAPLDSSELVVNSAHTIARWVWRSLSPFPPIGLRHDSLPCTGMLAAARTLAFAQQDHVLVRFEGLQHAPTTDVLTMIPCPRVPSLVSPEPSILPAPMNVSYGRGCATAADQLQVTAGWAHDAETGVVRAASKDALATPLLAAAGSRAE